MPRSREMTVIALPRYSVLDVTHAMIKLNRTVHNASVSRNDCDCITTIQCVGCHPCHDQIKSLTVRNASVSRMTVIALPRYSVLDVTHAMIKLNRSLSVMPRSREMTVI